MRSARFWAVVLLLCSTLLIRLRRGDVDYVPPSAPLDRLPATIGQYSATDVPLAQETLDVLGKGIFLNRVYKPGGVASAETRPDPISLFIGYFPTQRSGQSIHSPQNCLPGAGWVFQSSGTTQLQGQDGKPLEVGDYVIVNGDNKAEVLYWYQTHGHSIANDYKAKLVMLANSIRYNRSDAALVRILTPISAGEPREAAHQRLLAFANRVSPLLPTYIPN